MTWWCGKPTACGVLTGIGQTWVRLLEPHPTVNVTVSHHTRPSAETQGMCETERASAMAQLVPSNMC